MRMKKIKKITRFIKGIGIFKRSLNPSLNENSKLTLFPLPEGEDPACRQAG